MGFVASRSDLAELERQQRVALHAVYYDLLLAQEAFITVSDFDAYVSRVARLGGTVIELPHDIPGVGRASMVADPLGAVVQRITPASEP